YNFKFFSIDTNGTSTTFDTTLWLANGISPEDFDIIPPNQDLYLCDQDTLQNASGAVMKFSRSLLTNFAGDLLITQGGEIVPGHPSQLFIIHRNGIEFEVRSISYFHSAPFDGHLEHVSFAPIDIPSNPQ